MFRLYHPLLISKCSQGYRQEFNKIEANHTTRIEREELLRGSGINSSLHPSNSVLSRRDMYLKESGHAHNSQSMINDQISIAMETKEHLLTQRQSFKRLQTRFNDLSNRFPVISRFVGCIIRSTIFVSPCCTLINFNMFSSTSIRLIRNN